MLVVVIWGSSSFAYYNSEQGRWMSRDPIDEEGSVVTRQTSDGLPNEQQSININPYIFVRNSTPNFLDAYGLDITLTSGNKNAAWWQFGNRIFHQAICVDTWVKDKDNPCCMKKGKRLCFSFAQTGIGLRKPSKNWLGYNSRQFGGPLQGEVYSTYDKGRTDSGSISTTCEQDKEFLQLLVSMIGLQDTYSLGRHSCRTFSQMMFEKAQNKYQSSTQQSSGTCQCPVQD